MASWPHSKATRLSPPPPCGPAGERVSTMSHPSVRLGQRSQLPHSAGWGLAPEMPRRGAQGQWVPGLRPR